MIVLLVLVPRVCWYYDGVTVANRRHRHRRPSFYGGSFLRWDVLDLILLVLAMETTVVDRTIQ